MPADALARALNGRRAGSGYTAKCPAHDDRNPSLSITDHDGRLLVCCHAGCSQDAVIDALKARGLWPERDSWEQRIVATYDYTDAAGNLLYQVVRMVPKEFRQRRPDGRGGWTWNMRGVDRVLYRLPEVIEAPIVFLVEGEKDCETLRSWGFVSTTAPGGASAPWLQQYTDALRGREVILIPDNDAPGWQRAKDIYRALDGNVVCLRVFDLPPGIKDISDWFDHGHSECEFLAQLEGVENV